MIGLEEGEREAEMREDKLMTKGESVRQEQEDTDMMSMMVFPPHAS